MRRRLAGARARLLAGLLLAAAVLVGLPSADVPPAQAAPATGGFEQTRTLERTFTDADGTREVVDSREVTVTVDKTQQLRSRERVHVSWSGARPSGARAADPYGETGLAQEYPVVVLQCRGLDDPDLPAAQRLSRDTCWTSTRAQRSQSLPDRTAVWRHDTAATEEERSARAGTTPLPDAATCAAVDGFSTWATGFTAADGDRFASCSAETMAPEAAVDGALPPAEVAAFTDADGRGSVDLEVRTDVENASLGCNATTPCSIVVIPIMGLSCDTDPECRRSGRWLEGSSNYASEGVDLAVSPALWWSASNWQHRFSVPLTFGLAPNVCDVLDPRAPVGFYGSELLAQASLQWAPAYCLEDGRFKFQHNRMSDEAGFALMESGEGAAALVSGPHDARRGTSTAYGPTAVTGFGVAYVVDRPDNAGAVDELRLNARLVAKLLTQSYVASDLGRGHPGMGDNPTSINQDPEFVALNPDLDRIAREAAATVLSISESSDVIGALTAYVAADPDAAAFVQGRPDPWGMRVNPSYAGMALPVRDFPLLDTYVPSSEQECLKANPSVYFNQVAAPVTTLRRVAEAVLDAWPNVQTRCERSSANDPWRVGRVNRQGLGTRFMLGIVSLGDAARLGLSVAELQTREGTFVGPTTEGLTKAVALARPATDTVGVAEAAVAPYVVDQQAVRQAGDAYPGTLVVHTVARTHGLPAEQATDVAQFLQVATTEGQRPGRGNGTLPEGYLPITDAGATAPLWRSAQRAAELVAAQEAPTVAPPVVPGTDTGAPSFPAGGGVGDLPGAVPAADAPAAAGATAPAGGAAAVTTAATAPVSSPWTSSALLPLLLVLTLVGALGGAVGRVVLVARKVRS
ncbi:hypothetical protein [Nocardioides zeae]|uniref:PBP domain-containing protein n=1 Tax=Nocardioides zeae TaxID=1457234 RepID=A0AAJ1U288_9ACTN|nr:hypothetical protein [Nocardioides zeae]MDQ1104565.1 hypothetical protein [Nocardioides zeae]